MQGNNQGTLPDIRQTVVLNAPIHKVWNAVSTSEGIAEWFMPNNFQPAIGNEFTLRTPYGISHCKVTEFDPPNRLAFTWGEEWHVTFELEELDGKTRLTLIHSGWKAGKIIKDSGEEHSVVRDRMDRGWESSVLPRLRNYVEA